MARPPCKVCGKTQAVRPGGLCNKCFAAEARPKGEPMNVHVLPLESITADPAIQVRAGGTPEPTAREYADALSRPGTKFPPLVVFQDESGQHWLADGFTRRRGYELAGRAECECEVHEGSRRDALLYAIGANSSHGLPRNSLDKHNAVMLLLKDPEWSHWSTQKIAEAARVSYSFAQKVRDDHEAATGEAPATRTTADGRQYPAHLKRREVPGADEAGSISRAGDAPEVEGEGGRVTVGPAKVACWMCPNCGRPIPEVMPVCGDCGATKPVHDRPIPERARPEPAPERPQLRDPLGTVIPPHLQDHFGDEFLRQAVDQLLAIRKGLRSVGTWAPFVRLAEAVKGVEDACQAIEDGVPYCVHKRCRGQGCRDCRQCGYLPRWVHDEMSQTGGAA